MDEWQRKHICNNLAELCMLTQFNKNVNYELLANNVISEADVEKFKAVEKQSGSAEAARYYHQLLMGRRGAYEVLTRVLIKSNQTGAARILIEGVPTKLIHKLVTHLGISTQVNKFKDAEVEVHGKVFKLHEFFSTVNYEHLQQIFYETVSELEIYDTFITKERPFVLAIDTIPPKSPFYIPRFLSNRIRLDKSIFKTDFPDVFVFKKNIPRYKLSQIARPHFTDVSTSQLTNITCRFIYLDENEDWAELKKLAKVPIHLIQYEQDGSHFLLEDTSAATDLLSKLGHQYERVYMSEDEFVRQQLSGHNLASSVCICDTPGMGKTFLLANIARTMTQKSTRRIIVFIPMIEFSTEFSPTTDTWNDTALLIVLKYTSNQNNSLLLKLIHAKLLQIDIFFDGFDELSSDKVELVKKVFFSINTQFSNVMIYVTSRPHMRQELESILGTVAYDILPFNQQSQVDFLVQLWQRKEPHSDQLSLQNYANSCLNAVNTSLTKNGKEIAGIPLLCQLIAEVYADKVAFNSIKKRKFNSYSPQISVMHQKFIKKKISLVAKNKDELDKIKLVHIWHALCLLFPMEVFHQDNLFRNAKDSISSLSMLRVGILQMHSNGALEFIHRSFAEYLVAEHFFTKLQAKEKQKTEENNRGAISMLKLILKCEKSIQGYKFVNHAILSFLNSLLGEVSEELKIQTATFLSSISHTELILILSACCQHNFIKIFSLLGKALTKWETSCILECFSNEKSYELLTVCIREASSQLFQMCIQLLTEVLKLDIKQIVTHEKENTLLQRAVRYAHYEAVEYLVDRISLQNQSLLEACIEYSYEKDDVEKRVNILHLLINKNHTLVHETLHILLTNRIDLGIFKTLVKIGANLTAINEHGNNVVMNAACYMSSTDFHELVQFLLIDCKADYLFLDNEKWKDPLPYIIRWATLLPETLELLLNIPGIQINMKDKLGDNLLFSAASGNKMDNFQQLVDRGLDSNARGLWNRSVLHAAAMWAEVNMVRYLLSLKLDPNSRDKREWTPLHYAAENVFYGLNVTEVLVENGANVQAKDWSGQTALHFAANEDFSSIEVVKYLVTKGAEVNDRDNAGNTPLHLCERKEVRDCLIEMGADIHAKNKKGQTPAQKNPDMWKSKSYLNSDTQVEMDVDFLK